MSCSRSCCPVEVSNVLMSTSRRSSSLSIREGPVCFFFSSSSSFSFSSSSSSSSSSFSSSSFSSSSSSSSFSSLLDCLFSPSPFRFLFILYPSLFLFYRGYLYRLCYPATSMYHSMFHDTSSSRCTRALEESATTK